MADTQAQRTSGQEPTDAASAAGRAGSGYSAQAADAGTDERPGADGGAPTPRAQHDVQSVDNLTHEDALAALKAARAEAAENRRKAAELDVLKRKLEDEKLSESERLQKAHAEALARIAELERAQRDQFLRGEVRGEAATLGLPNPDKAWKLISLDAIVVDEATGAPKNIHELLAQALDDLGLTDLLTANATAASAAISPASPTATAGGGGLAARPVAAVAPQTGATNPSRQGQIAGANGVFAANEIPKLGDSRLWKRGH